MNKETTDLMLSQFDKLNRKLDTLTEAILKDKKHNQQDLGDWLTSQQAQTLLEIGNTSLWGLRRTGKVKFSKIGGRVYYSRQSILGYLEKNKM